MWTAILGLRLTLGLIGLAPAPAQDIPAFARELPAIETGAPVLAFNGENLDGFYTYLRDSKYEDPRGVFQVDDGVLRISGEEFGGLITEGAYADYHLIVEWKWGDETFAPREDRARDSGLLLHCVGPDRVWMQSQECQIIEGGCGDFIIVGGEARPSLTCAVVEGPGDQLWFDPVEGGPVTRDQGRFNWWGRDPEWTDTLGFRGARDVEKRVGEWNRMEVVCQGDTITNIVNGYVVNVGTASSQTKGKILMQSEGAELFVRRFEVRPLIGAEPSHVP